MNNNNGMINVADMVRQVAQSARDGVYEEHSGVYTAEEFVNRVMAKLRAITKGYTKKLGSAAGEVEYKRQLALALAENDLVTDEAIEPALNYYRGRDEWFPTPAQFIGACLMRQVEGCPPARTAYMEYCLNVGKKNYKWSHPIVRDTVRLSGRGYDIKSLPEEKAFPLYEQAYQILMDRLRKGEEIDVPIQRALPAEASSRQTTPKENVGHMAAMRADLGI
tara:strand:- start:1015 stop:1677 length:663 start_codon:yes stop_codon:yes gene_type:complete